MAFGDWDSVNATSLTAIEEQMRDDIDIRNRWTCLDEHTRIANLVYKPVAFSNTSLADPEFETFYTKNIPTLFHEPTNHTNDSPSRRKCYQEATPFSS